ncbi:MAG: hypothetical protein H0T66_11225 [Geodermatophilaceae bacterium]|nr:hypothetical protein [Geodermatophilaceae bacterium]
MSGLATDHRSALHLTTPLGCAEHVPRSTTMLLMHEDLARARMRELHSDAVASARARRVLAARRWQRRADRAALRARLARNAIR